MGFMSNSICWELFQSTPSARKVTAISACLPLNHYISIHTFREEGDGPIDLRAAANQYFNPHLPRGRWQHVAITGATLVIFQSTPSARKVTRQHLTLMQILSISIHTFREEGDFTESEHTRKWVIFQSTPSARKVTAPKNIRFWFGLNFNPHLPRGRWLQIRNKLSQFLCFFTTFYLFLHLFSIHSNYISSFVSYH